MSPRLDPSNLPVGPDTDASAPAPEVVEQKQVEKQRDLPKAAPTETDDPDRVVSPNATQKPVKDDPTPATAAADPSEASPAVEQTAVPSVERQQSPRSVAPSPGIGESEAAARHLEKELAAHFNRFKRYPSDRVMQSAKVIVGFVLDRIGHVVSTRIIQGSGDASFDAAALAMLQRADPVPAPPPLVADENLTFSVPVDFAPAEKLIKPVYCRRSNPILTASARGRNNIRVARRIEERIRQCRLRCGADRSCRTD